MNYVWAPSVVDDLFFFCFLVITHSLGVGPPFCKSWMRTGQSVANLAAQSLTLSPIPMKLATDVYWVVDVKDIFLTVAESTLPW